MEFDPSQSCRLLDDDINDAEADGVAAVDMCRRRGESAPAYCQVSSFSGRMTGVVQWHRPSWRQRSQTMRLSAPTSQSLGKPTRKSISEKAAIVFACSR